MKYTSVRDIENAERRHRLAISEFLESKGWKYDDIPGVLFVWTREWGGKMLMGPESTAIEMQGNIDAMGPCPDCGEGRDGCECIPF